MLTYLEFERPIAELDAKITELRELARENPKMPLHEDIKKLEKKSDQALKDLYKKLTPWQKVQVSRHPSRPHTIHYINHLFQDYVPLSGDRLFAEDKSIVGGLASFEDRSVVVIGTEKGSDLDSRLLHNFGAANPEGYRKASRLMRLADRFSLPIITFIDTAGAYPGRGAEERGQAEAIASCLKTSFDLKVPIVSVVIGEGGSGGAIALGCGNRVLMLEHAIYSVISPEGAASILWRDAMMAQTAASAMRITAQDLLGFRCIDQIISEPVGGAHRDVDAQMRFTRETLRETLDELSEKKSFDLRRERQEKFLSMTTLASLEG